MFAGIRDLLREEERKARDSGIRAADALREARVALQEADERIKYLEQQLAKQTV